MRWGSVIGRRWARPPDGTSAVRLEEHVFLARIGSPMRSDPFAADRPDLTARWTPRAVLGDVLREPHSDRTTDLVDGYLDGWLPAGPITLF